MATYEIKLNQNTKIGKEIFLFLQQHNVQMKLKDPTKMTKEEFYAKIKRAKEQYERGEGHRLEYNDISKFLGLE